MLTAALFDEGCKHCLLCAAVYLHGAHVFVNPPAALVAALARSCVCSAATQTKSVRDCLHAL